MRKKRFFPKRTHCKLGHLLTENNLYVGPKSRQCRTCSLIRAKTKYRESEQHKQAQKERSQRYYSENYEWHRMVTTLSKYKISLDQYHSAFESQDFSCAICGEYTPLVVDHCHASGKFRGLLCKLCNAGIGMLKENSSALKRAVVYLEKHVDFTKGI